MNPNFLSDAEKAAIVGFCQNTTAFNAVRKVLLAAIYTDGTLQDDDPSKNWAVKLASKLADNVSADQLGRAVQANVSALSFIEDAFIRLSSVRLDQPAKPTPNPAL